MDAARSILLITGAGASSPLGANGRPLPTMPIWSDELRSRLDSHEQGLANAVGLREGMRGDEFEEAIGLFLEWQASFPLIERFHRFGGPQPGSVTGDVQQWMARNTSRATTVLAAIHTSLYENFNARRIDTRLAIDGFGALFSPAARTRGDRLVCATTNYDPALELWLSGIGFDVRDGFPRLNHWETPVLRPEGVVAAGRATADREIVAVLHLHGAVGWYRSRNGRIEAHPPDQHFNESLGVPALLLPDPKKDPSLYAGVDAIWREFADALETCTHVLILGHSLHDQHLVEQIQAHSRNARVAVTVLPGLPDEIQRVSGLLPQAEVLELKFGQRLQGNTAALAEFFRRTTPEDDAH